jgi:hypothetical protein
VAQQRPVDALKPRMLLDVFSTCTHQVDSRTVRGATSSQPPPDQHHWICRFVVKAFTDAFVHCGTRLRVEEMLMNSAQSVKQPGASIH